ncbi:fructose-specific PTS transporter subunit EIIC [Streptomyces ossamyceticus]|uniref:fructose-specific PTS transporter subunit EIIC n=1 Tax=Streptomyces ossamyceticus TaxID=249581 RepID=UPI0036F18D64
MNHPGNRTTVVSAAPMDHASDRSGHIGIRIGGWLASSTPYMAPLAAVGGLLTVLAFVISGPDITATMSALLNDGSWTEPGTWAALLLQTGASALGLFAPVVAGYVAYGMAGLPALAPGLLGGIVAMNFRCGFLGGLIAGLIAGSVTMLVQRVTVPSALRAMTTMAIGPLVSATVTTAVVVVFVGPQISELAQWLNHELPPLTWGSSIVCGLVLGLMVSSDISGTISKAAVGFAVTGVETAPNSLNFTIMATVVAAGMVPPLSLALATVVRGSLFSPAERTYGKTAWLFGAAFVPEGAIPFAVADPLRVIPASMAGGAVTGALTMTFGSTLTFPYGGVFAAGHFGRPLLFVAAVAVGVLVTTGLVLVLKSLRRTAPATATATATPRTRTAVPVSG